MDFIENFTIPFHNIQIDNWSTKKRKLLEICNSLSQLKIHTSSQFSYGDPLSKVYSDYYKNYNYTHQVFEILQDDLNNFSNKIQTSCSLDNVWFQRYTKGNFHTPHDHGSIGYSSICFIEYDENEHNPPRFLCPFKSVHGNCMEYSPDNVTEGTMIFFPSMLIHYVVPTTSDKIRTIMSMNIGI